jgi:hypothetical protein
MFLRIEEVFEKQLNKHLSLPDTEALLTLSNYKDLLYENSLSGHLLQPAALVHVII